jgi:hypothetical protein
MKRTAWRVVNLALCLAMTTLLAVAQTTTAPKAAPRKAAARKPKPMADAPAPQWSSISVVHVKPDMLAEWQDLQKNVVNPALKKAGLKERGIFETAVFGESYEFVVITPITSFAQYDEPMSPLRKTLGEDAYRDYQAKSRRSVVSVHTYGEMARLDLSYMGKMASMTGPPKLAVVNSVSIVPGRAAAFESLVKTEILPAMKKADVLGYFVSQSFFGGDAWGYTSVTFVDSFAEIGKGSPFLRALGPAGSAALLAKFSGLVAHQERVIARYNTDLSFFSAP